MFFATPRVGYDETREPLVPISFTFSTRVGARCSFPRLFPSLRWNLRSITNRWFTPVVAELGTLSPSLLTCGDGNLVSRVTSF